MKLRYMFVFIFILIAIVPTTLFWMWPYSKALESEIDDVKDRHLVIAKNLSTAFERYYQDVTSVFEILDPESDEKLGKEGLNNLLSGFEFTMVAVVDSQGKVDHCVFHPNLECPATISNDILLLAQNTVEEQGVKVSTVTEDPSIDSGPIFLVVKHQEDKLMLAYLSTKYVVAMGKKVAFGEKGHAAIVDQAGNVLAHPLDSWIKERKNISMISSVQKMLEGKTGVELFYSPALKGDMIAGYTTVANAKWGVMVPQPILELENKAQNIDETAIFVMLLGLGLALLITIPVSMILIKPLEQLITTIKRIERGDSKTALNVDTSSITPVEIRDLKSSFILMMNNIEVKEREISKLAYFDGQTNLPNRNYFRQLSEQALSKMTESKSSGAFVFIDFDDFKLVNDNYGHKIGDDLLSKFAMRLSEYFSIQSDDDLLSYFNALPDIIPARLGGDEFVILIQNISSINDVEDMIKGLFDEVFSTYSFQGNVELSLTGSAGIAIFPAHGMQVDEIMKSADMAMYKAKALGKNRIYFSSIE
ncbi:diguanylate cyclase domain-containing protein [Vibrio sp. WJH972]